MKKHFSTVFFSIIMLIGLSLLLYPSISNYWNSFHQSRAIATYSEAVANVDDDRYKEILAEARDYNEWLAERTPTLDLDEDETERYDDVLDLTGTGIMGYVEIPKINCSLPIYHGVDEAVLQIAIGHIPGTSLPIGGPSTHCVLSGHRGLPSARLLTDIDQLVEGDTFYIRTLDEVMAYEVDQILIVLPSEIDSLRITEGEDYCTLVSCTPYGINTHRILVRGHRVDSDYYTEMRVAEDAYQIEPIFVAPMIAIPLLFILFILAMVTSGKRR